MLIRTQRDLKSMSHEYERSGKHFTCIYCNQLIGFPPAIQVKSQIYHKKCAMQMVYGILEALSGYGLEQEQHLQQYASMEEAFRAAAHGDSI